MNLSFVFLLCAFKLIRSFAIERWFCRASHFRQNHLAPHDNHSIESEIIAKIK